MTIMPEDMIELERLYNEAVEEKKESFIVDGQEILTQFAKYLIEYIKENKLAKPAIE